MQTTTLPGTAISAPLTCGAADRLLTPLFSGGGLVLSQVSQLTGLEGYIIQNWIKRKYLAPPERKKYTRRQLCRILNINVLKDCFTLEQTAALLSYLNGILTDESDDLIDDSLLYAYFTDCLAGLAELGAESDPGEQARAVIARVIADYRGPHPGAPARLALVLEIMLTAHEAQQTRRRALALFGHMDYK
jgi:hypothetical protein